MDRHGFWIYAHAGGGSQGEGQGGAAVGMAVPGLGGAVGDLAGGGDDAVDGVEVFADFAGNGDEDFLFLERGAEAGEEFAFQLRRELAEFDFAGAVVSRVP